MNLLNNIYDIFLEHGKVNTDTRSLQSGELFFALKGDNFNGNKFTQKALDIGASAVIIDEDHGITNSKVFLVDDVLTTLQELATHHRKQLDIPVIGITGSNGKTTSKELIRDVLSTQLKVLATKGNLNNHIGVPLTLLSIQNDVEIAIIEMGANHQKEIEKLCSIALPTHGYVTNFGKAHLEGFGGVEGIIKGKSELYDFIRSTNGLVFINQDDPIQVDKTEGIKKSSFGQKNADCIITNKSKGAEVQLAFEGQYISSQLFGSYNFTNAAAAIAIGHFFGIRDQHIHTAIAAYRSEMNRSEILKTENNTLVMDAYNANPSSMKLSIASFLELDGPNKTIILADMFELGAFSKEEHQQVVDQLKNEDISVILIGEHFSKSKAPQAWNKFISTEEAISFFSSNPIRNNIVLLKGSRGMKLESLVTTL